MMFDVLGLILEECLQGGICMLPILLLSIFMFSQIVRQLYALVLERNRLHVLLHQTPGEMMHQPNELGFYAETRTGVSSVNGNLRDVIHKGFLSRHDHSADILLCASLATVFGLLGTVMGMMQAFDAMQAGDLGQVNDLATGVSEALITTQSGLMVAAIGFIAGKSLRQFAYYQGMTLLHLLNTVEHSFHQRQDKEVTHYA